MCIRDRYFGADVVENGLPYGEDDILGMVLSIDGNSKSVQFYRNGQTNGNPVDISSLGLVAFAISTRVNREITAVVDNFQAQPPNTQPFTN